MFINRYRTSHEIREPQARTMSMLQSVNLDRPYSCTSTHSVVKFMVKVRLVEKRVKRKVGRVMEVKVTSQYKMAGTRRTPSETRAPSKTSHDRVTVSCWVLAIAEA